MDARAVRFLGDRSAAVAVDAGGAGGDGDVLFWEETDGSLPSEDSLLALLRVDAHGARFVEDALLGPILTALKPAEDAFYALIADAED